MKINKKIAVEICSVLLAVLFIYTGVSKLIDWSETRFSFLNQVFPDSINKLLLYTIPPVEILIAIMLLIPRFRQNAFLGSMILMGAFTLYVGLVLTGVFGRIPCSCGGIVESLSWEWHFVVNLLFLFISAVGYFLMRWRRVP